MPSKWIKMDKLPEGKLFKLGKKVLLLTKDAQYEVRVPKIVKNCKCGQGKKVKVKVKK